MYKKKLEISKKYCDHRISNDKIEIHCNSSYLLFRKTMILLIIPLHNTHVLCNK